jgi:DNA-binding NarL/FixJ family response regulator
MTRVAIIDDHPLARRGIESILGEAAGLQIVASVAQHEHLAATIGDGGKWPDVVLLDLYLGDGVPCLTAIAHLRVVTKVIVVSASGHAKDVLAALSAGVLGYVTKLTEPEMLVLAVRTVAGGGFALSPLLADILHGELAAGRKTGHGAVSGFAGQDEDPAGKVLGARPVALSPREEETLDLIARGAHAPAGRYPPRGQQRDRWRWA